MQAKDFQNIIFDLGGVIINLDESKTVDAFAQCSHLSKAFIQEQILKFESYYDFEKGLIIEAEFRQALRENFGVLASDGEIDGCMNAMLLDIPKTRIELLESLRSSHQLFLLSNTNEIHWRRFNAILKETTGESSIDVYFQKAYYSHQVNLRKPDPKIFQLVLEENNLNASETLFLDDNLDNLAGAQSLGISTVHIKNPAQLFDLFL